MAETEGWNAEAEEHHKHGGSITSRLNSIQEGGSILLRESFHYDFVKQAYERVQISSVRLEEAISDAIDQLRELREEPVNEAVRRKIQEESKE